MIVYAKPPDLSSPYEDSQTWILQCSRCQDTCDFVNYDTIHWLLVNEVETLCARCDKDAIDYIPTLLLGEGVVIHSPATAGEVLAYDEEKGRLSACLVIQISTEGPGN